MAEDSPAVIDALTNDLNARQPGFVPVVVSGPAHGQVVVNTDGSFSFTPEKDWSGQDTFTYKLSDGHVDSNLATVSLTVTPVNDAPTLADSKATLAEDGALTLDPVGWVDAGYPIAVAQDIDGDLLTARLIAGPAHGTLTVNLDGSYTYAPEANYFGSHTYIVNDGAADSNVATVTLTVTPVNDAPTAGDRQLATNEDIPLTGNLLAAAADIDSTQLQGAVVAGPQHGQVKVAAESRIAVNSASAGAGRLGAYNVCQQYPG